MKKSTKLILFTILILSTIVWVYFYADYSYNKTKISINKQSSEVLITKLTTKDEIETIINEFDKIGVAFHVNHVTYLHDRLSSIDFDISDPIGAKVAYSAISMRLSREIKIVLYHNLKNEFIINID